MAWFTVFPGSLQQAERFVQLGYKIGVGGTITYPRASKTRDVIAKLPLASLLLETDAPDMPLNGFQGRLTARNRPPGYLPCCASCARNRRMRLPKCWLNNTYAVFSVRGSLPFVGSIRQLAHNA
ncbi:TatD family hydrolase [Escherichia coli]